MPLKVPGAGNAVGYWGRSPYCRIQQDQTPQKIRALLQDKLQARGQPVKLWIPVTESNLLANSVECTCRKDTTQSNDRPCPECYGTGYTPGFKQFLHEEVFYTASNLAAGTGAATDVELRRDFKPNYLHLSAGAVTGTLVSDPLPFSNPGADAFEFHVDGYEYAPSTVLVEGSVNGGPWLDLTAAAAAVSLVLAGTITFRVTLTRASADARSPHWSAVRMRHVESPFARDINRPDLDPGCILVLRPWIQEQAQSDSGRGVLIEWMGDRSWTSPLDYFDTRIVPDTPPARVPDREPGPHPFYEYASGIKTGDRVVLTSFKWNEELGIFTHQNFDERRAQEFEPPYSDVW